MSTAEETLASPLILTPRQRRNPVVFPEDPTDEELARDWTLSEADKAEVLRCRTNRHLLSFAIQLCVLRAHGRFLADCEAVGARITNHLCRQLNLPPDLFVNPPQREATDLEHEHRIRDHLGFRPFRPGGPGPARAIGPRPGGARPLGCRGLPSRRRIAPLVEDHHAGARNPRTDRR